MRVRSRSSHSRFFRRGDLKLNSVQIKTVTWLTLGRKAPDPGTGRSWGCGGSGTGERCRTHLGVGSGLAPELLPLGLVVLDDRERRRRVVGSRVLLDQPVGRTG